MLTFAIHDIVSRKLIEHCYGMFELMINVYIIIV